MFSIVVLHHNKAPYSRACLESLLVSSARPLEIINVDNGSRDDTPRLLNDWEASARQNGIETQRLSFAENVGAVRGRNAALEVARGERIAFLDNDTVIAQKNWLEVLEATLAARSDCGIAVPRLLFPWSPFDIECCGAAVSKRGRIAYLERGEPGEKPLAARELQCAISAAWLMKRELVEKIGLLDEAFSPVQYEDLDFCFRAREAGFSIWTAPDARVFHFEHTTTAGSDDINFAYVTTKNGLEFKRRWERVFSGEEGPGETEAAWKTLPRRSIEEVDWRALLPS